MNRIILKRVNLCLIYLVSLSIPCFADCNPDTSTATPVGIPSSVNTALGLLPTKLGGPVKLFGQSISITATGSPTATIMESNCKDDNGCDCGVSDDGNISDTISLSFSASINAPTIGPVSSTAGGYLVSFSASASASISGSASLTASGSVSRTCGDDTWHYTVYGTATANGTASGTASAGFTVSNADGSNPTTYGVTGNVTGTEAWTFAAQTSDTASATGTAAFGGGSLNYTFTLSPFGSFTYTQIDVGVGF